MTDRRPFPPPRPLWTTADDAVMDQAARWYHAQDERAALRWLGDVAFLHHVGQLPIDQWAFLLRASRRILARRERVRAHPSLEEERHYRPRVYPPTALVCDPGDECVWRTPAIRDGCPATCPTRRSPTP
jgi:hypothetical protein